MGLYLVKPRGVPKSLPIFETGRANILNTEYIYNYFSIKIIIKLNLFTCLCVSSTTAPSANGNDI